MNTHQNQILRCPDDAAGTATDPLDTPVGEPPEYPLMQGDTVMRFLITGVEKKRKEETGNEQVVFKCAAQAESRSTAGDTLHKGFVIPHRVNSKETEKVIKTRIRDDFMALANACGISGPKVSELIANPDVFLNKLFDAKVGVVKSKNPQYNDSNSLRPVPLPT